MTDWKGVYVFDVELNRSWCKPNGDMQNEAELRDLNRQYIHQSQLTGYFISFVLSVLTITLMVIYDCHISGKCDFCPKYCRQTAGTQTEEQGSATMGQELQVSGSFATTGQQESWSSASIKHKQQGAEGFAAAPWQLDSSDTVRQEKKGLGRSALAGHGQQRSVSSAPMGSTTIKPEWQKLLPLPHQGHHQMSNLQMSNVHIS
ncbi:uncharacterized protein LOC107757460 [Sinocyclocheilus rhinocerous]|uniref:uncharacterized protein LOC107757460 n=1 Tax=Sinocyclocheilus rhinocerous TaxID=307959 RepID=UPI0007B7BB03|nr:PREDICTED: uncharacterized protein LOC107757460 [Sinocyclocheilus rhinocerous]